MSPAIIHSRVRNYSIVAATRYRGSELLKVEFFLEPGEYPAAILALQPPGDGWREPGMQRWKSDRDDEFFYLKLLLAAVVVILIVAGLIEWNARRQAAAMTRELLRPATP